MGRNTELNIEDLAYTVAKKVVVHGLAASTVAAELFPEEYRDPATKSRAIMRVKHALDIARDKKLLKLSPPEDESLRIKLGAKYNNIEFVIVRDRTAYSEDMADVVGLSGARAIALEISSLLDQSAKAKKQVCVGNCGGPVLSNALRFLRPEITASEEQSRRLLFVSMNSARRADAYHLDG